MTEDYYYHDKNCPDFKLVNNSVLENLLPRKILENRPPKTELPKYLAEAGNLQFEFLLDFGSFRDIQRHRAVIQRMPLLTTEIGFEKWYLGELPKELQAKAQDFLKKQEFMELFHDYAYYFLFIFDDEINYRKTFKSIQLLVEGNHIPFLNKDLLPFLNTTEFDKKSANRLLGKILFHHWDIPKKISGQGKRVNP